MLCPYMGGLRYFNSQPHKEADQVFHSFCFLLSYFNSQPHKEADPALDLRVSASMYFNSQPHKEADIKPTEGE